MPRTLLLLFLLFGAVGMASALQRASQARTPVAIATEMRDELRAVRTQLDACLLTQDRVELRFQALARETRGLRDELDFLEGLDARGVPSERYERYLELVAAFNASIPEWERQAIDLRLQEARCRTLIGVHNEQVEALRIFLVEHGIWDESWLLPETIVEPEEGDGEDDDPGEERELRQAAP